MMYPRLFLARQLLRDDGVIFVSIDDHEVHNLRMVMNEIFGEECFIANIVWKRTVSGAISGKSVVVAHDHILCYAKNGAAELNRLDVADEKSYRNLDNDPRGPYKLQKLAQTLEGARPSMTFTIETPKGPVKKTWGVNDNRVAFSRTGEPYCKQFSQSSHRLMMEIFVMSGYSFARTLLSFAGFFAALEESAATAAPEGCGEAPVPNAASSPSIPGLPGHGRCHRGRNLTRPPGGRPRAARRVSELRSQRERFPFVFMQGARNFGGGAELCPATGGTCQKFRRHGVLSRSL